MTNERSYGGHSIVFRGKRIVSETELILNQYKLLTAFLGNFLGPDYEVILHDVSHPPFSIIAIANGYISGRKVGGPLTDTALSLLRKKDYEKNNYTTSYCGRSGSGKVMRAATMYIKNSKGDLIGLLCMNFDDSHYKDWLAKFPSLLHPPAWLDDYRQLSQIEGEDRQAAASSTKDQGVIPTETYYDNIDELMLQIYRDATANIQIPVDNLTQQDRIQIVEELDQRGIFKLKGAVNFVAKSLACSQATVYRYLNQLGEKN